MIVPESKTRVPTGLASGCEGRLVLTDSSAQLFQAWKTYLRDRFAGYYATVFEAPSFIGRDVIDVTRYAEHFPQHLVRAGNRTPELYLTPASCFHVYPFFAGRPPIDGAWSALVSGSCARYEGGHWEPPLRLASFQMMEVVVMGRREYVQTRRQHLLCDVARMFEELGIPGGFEPANDAFYLASSRGARLLQQLKGLKQEFRAPYEGKTVAVASVNDHEEYFGRAFGIRDASNRPASSFCAAFGLERLTAVGLHCWGPSPENWPEGMHS